MVSSCLNVGRTRRLKFVLCNPRRINFCAWFFAVTSWWWIWPSFEFLPSDKGWFHLHGYVSSQNTPFNPRSSLHDVIWTYLHGTQCALVGTAFSAHLVTTMEQYQNRIGKKKILYRLVVSHLRLTLSVDALYIMRYEITVLPYLKSGVWEYW